MVNQTSFIAAALRLAEKIGLPDAWQRDNNTCFERTYDPDCGKDVIAFVPQGTDLNQMCLWECGQYININTWMCKGDSISTMACHLQGPKGGHYSFSVSMKNGFLDHVEIGSKGPAHDPRHALLESFLKDMYLC